MDFQEYKRQIELKKGGKLYDPISMSVEQFWKMQEQAYDIGKSEGAKNNLPNPFGDLFKNGGAR